MKWIVWQFSHDTEVDGTVPWGIRAMADGSNWYLIALWKQWRLQKNEQLPHIFHYTIFRNYNYPEYKRPYKRVMSNDYLMRIDKKKKKEEAKCKSTTLKHTGQTST